MTPKEKAKYLVDRFHPHADEIEKDRNQAKECALICVEEMMECTRDVLSYGMSYLNQMDYLEEVKQEIEKL